MSTPESSIENICTVGQVVPALPTQDGAGVSLFRAIGQPALTEIDPFLLLDEMHSDNPDEYIAGFPSHPHRGFETLSYMISGEMQHEDSRGNKGLVGSGGVQWMRAARGIIHSEKPAQDQGLLWGYQLWINLPAAKKMAEPDYSDINTDKIPSVTLATGGTIKLIAGHIDDLQGPVVREDIDLIILDVNLPSNASFDFGIPEQHAMFCYISDGLIQFENVNAEPTAVVKRHTAVFNKGNRIKANASEHGGRFMLIAGKPIAEPVARQGPFVMNTREELRTAFSDYRKGKLG